MMNTIELVHKKDGIWLVLRAPSGKQAAINLTDRPLPTIVTTVLNELV
jgi:hypothetical protein